jgi:hypothetical protein
MILEEFIESNQLNICPKYIWLINSNLIQDIFKKVLLEDSLFYFQSPFFSNRSLMIKSEEFDSIDACLEKYGIDENSPISLEFLFSDCNKIIDTWEDFILHHSIYDKEFLPIGIIGKPNSSLLLLGVGKENYGEIWIEVSHSGTYLKLENSIFGFLSKLKFLEDDFVAYKLGNRKIYKNWNEDFWRVRDDE